ncbi:hypothetical protein [Streptomyces sp. AK02-01A]|uniref:hypothetical protein n=1 Tax=Streptomyces sp. AK02-01A TaxID=3028648 RepID=UPI0029A48AD5|nr:hypothetical protein [Streptomyces sp. AK02-01A]MDX3854309.1 hypothetical protein [Streptomyces sp. AK02-01A]
MSDRRMEGPGEHGAAIPRDMPDQQSRPGPDPLDITPVRPDESDEDDRSLPDADESGAGRRGSPNSGGVHPEQPVPDEPSG